MHCSTEVWLVPLRYFGIGVARLDLNATHEGSKMELQGLIQLHKFHSALMVAYAVA